MRFRFKKAVKVSGLNKGTWTHYFTGSGGGTLPSSHCAALKHSWWTLTVRVNHMWCNAEAQDLCAHAWLHTSSRDNKTCVPGCDRGTTLPISHSTVRESAAFFVVVSDPQLHRAAASIMRSVCVWLMILFFCFYYCCISTATITHLL